MIATPSMIAKPARIAEPARITKKGAATALVAVMLFFVSACASNSSTEIAPAVQLEVQTDSFYSFETRSLSGSPAKLSAYAGQVALAVNVASKCGLTPQYAKLESLYEELHPQGFTVLAFPSNDFGGQEPGTSAEIQSFCSENYGVSFPMFEKRGVKGEAKDEIFSFLTRDREEPNWNFTKYLINREGQVIARFGPRTEPDDAELRKAIEAALQS